MRPLDEPIPSTERLYRWVSSDDVDGDEVLPHAIDLARSSVNREKYWPNAYTAPPVKPQENGLAVTTPEDLPVGLLLNEVPYEFFAVDWPEEDNDAHAEIRSGRSPNAKRPQGDRPGGYKPGSREAKEELRQALASKMKVVKAPKALEMGAEAAQAATSVAASPLAGVLGAKPEPAKPVELAAPVMEGLPALPRLTAAVTAAVGGSIDSARPGKGRLARAVETLLQWLGWT